MKKQTLILLLTLLTFPALALAKDPTAKHEYLGLIHSPMVDPNDKPFFLESPLYVAIDSNDNVYVSGGNGNKNVHKFDSDGNFIGYFGKEGSGDGEFNYPRGIAVDGNDFIYVTDLSTARVQKFDSDGNFIAKWGSSGSGDGQFNGPSGITVDGLNNVYVADTSNHRVQKFDSDGNFLTKWGSPGNGDGQFNRPSDIYIDSSGNVYVTDWYNYRIQKFDSDGNFLAKYGIQGYGDGEFTGPVSLDGNSEGKIYVIDTAAISTAFNRVQVFDSSLNYLFKMYNPAVGSDDGQYSPFSVAFDSLGNYYIADINNSNYDRQIEKFDSDGNFLTKWGSYGNGDGQFTQIKDLVVDLDGNVYVVGSSTYTVQKFDSDGNLLTKWGEVGSGDGQLSSPEAIDIDSMGYIYVADHGNARVQKFDSDGNFVAKWGEWGTGSGQFGSLEDLALDSEGNVYVVDWSNYKILKFDNDGNFILEWGTNGSSPGEFGYIDGIAVDESDNVYVADYDNLRVSKFDSSGNFLTEFKNEDYQIHGEMTGLKKIKFGPGNKMYVVDRYKLIVFGDTESPTTGSVSADPDTYDQTTKKITLSLSASDTLSNIAQVLIS
ncbi:MAG: 6-bladed beta-propeller [Candidatus Moranbacteria bacterium]|nr:6-bladed beta-propeller [Candidatus Moranbacteria bacterium]